MTDFILALIFICVASMAVNVHFIEKRLDRIWRELHFWDEHRTMK